MNLRRKALAGGLAALLTLGVAACGGDDDAVEEDPVLDEGAGAELDAGDAGAEVDPGLDAETPAE